MTRARKQMTALVTALVLVSGMVSCENWMIEKLLEKNEPAVAEGTNSGNGGGVTPNPPVNIVVTGVVISPSGDLGGTVGGSMPLIATVYPSDATNKDVSWTSSKPEVVGVAGVGGGLALLEFKEASNEEVTITVKTAGGGFEDSRVVKKVVLPQEFVAAATINIVGAVEGDAGGKLNLTATVYPENATNKGVIWESDRPEVAYVANNGLVILGVPGEVIITATAAGGDAVISTHMITVKDVPVTGISPNTTSISGVAGAAFLLKATVLPENATNKEVKWSISPVGVATVDRDTGLVILISPTVNSGNATITAETVGLDAVGSKKSVNCTVKVNPVAVGSVAISQETLNLDVGSSPVKLTAFVEPYNATNKSIEWIVFSSSPTTGVVTVNSSGLVTPGTVAGTATIRATSANGKIADCSVTVNAVTVDKYKYIPGGTIAIGYAWSSTVSSPIDVAAFAIGRTEVRYELWYVVKQWGEMHGYTFPENRGRAGSNGTEGTIPTATNKDEPVTTVSWRDVVVWCNAHSEMAGKDPVYRNSGGDILRDSTTKSSGSNVEDLIDETKIGDYDGYRLPKEEEWEYAARGGEPSGDAVSAWTYTYAGSGTIEDVAWYYSNSGNKTHPVGQKAANSAGLYDMSGNVWEWCFDIFSGTSRVNRGGGWGEYVSYCSVAYRYRNPPDSAYNSVGFRVVCR